MNLTVVELEVLAGAAQGETNEQTGRRMHRSTWTIKNQRKSVLHKLGARNMAQAVAIAHQRGILGGQLDMNTLPIRETQRAAFNAKARDVDVARELERGTTKKRLLLEAGSQFGRQIESANDLTRLEASLVLDVLERMLDTGATPEQSGVLLSTMAATA